MIRSARAPVDVTTKIIAIDGCGGAGKSTLATQISAALDSCPVIHTDDFASWDNLRLSALNYLRPSQVGLDKRV